jgi:redox-sensitive bicupin YhaK (pirin superfamily)
MSVSTLLARSVDRVTTKQRLGPDAQVDDKALIIVPTDPALTDPFLMMAEDWFSEPGFEWHPHRGLETVTTVLDGVLEHGDNLGNVGALEAGDVQWMTAGRGIIHRELAFRNEHVHTLQLWLNLPARSKMTATAYQDVLAADRTKVQLPGAIVDVVSGAAFGATGPAVNHQPVQGAMVTLDPGAELDYVLPASHRAFVHVLTGAAKVAGRALQAGQTAWSDPSRKPGESRLLLEVPLSEHEPVKLMVYSGEPIREPVAFGGPFVMNKRSEIEQSFADFRAGKFGQVPRQQRLKRRRA